MCIYRESSCSQCFWAEKEDSVLRAGWDLCIKYSWHRGMHPSFMPALGSVYFGSAAREWGEILERALMYSNRAGLGSAKRQRGIHTEHPYWEKKLELIMCLICKGLQACVALFFRRVLALSVCNSSCTEPKYTALHWNGCEDFSFLPANHCLIFLLK